MALEARYAWRTGHLHAHDAKAWGGASAVAAVQVTRAGLGCPRAQPRLAPGRKVLVPQDGRAGAAALSTWLGKARLAPRTLPDTGFPATRRCGAPPKTLGTPPPLALGSEGFRPPKLPKLALPLDQGGAASVGSSLSGGRGPGPFSPLSTPLTAAVEAL